MGWPGLVSRKQEPAGSSGRPRVIAQDQRSRSRRRWSPRGAPYGDSRVRSGLQGTHASGAHDPIHLVGLKQESLGRRLRVCENIRDHRFQRRDSRRSCSGGDSATSSGSGSDSRPSCAEDAAAGDKAKGCTSGKKSAGASRKDEIIHFKWQPGLVLNRRYELVRSLGDGTFGRVVLAHDQREDRQVAIKIIRDVKRYMENAKIEASILKEISKADTRGVSRCAIMYESFVHENKFFCLVFEPLGVSIYEFMKKNRFRGFWMQDIQSFARQSLKALKFLHQSMRLTHTDLKPENILLQSMELWRPSVFPREKFWQETHTSSKGRSLAMYFRPPGSQIKIIDFGNATYEDEHHSSVINTRQYRGPEVVLELGWNERSDLWSLGCIFVELYTGELLFGTHENIEHLALMERTIERFPSELLARASENAKGKYLNQNLSQAWRLLWPERASSPSSERHVRNQRHLPGFAMREHQVFVQWAAQLLTLDPAKRPSASEALKHQFFSAQFDD